MSAKEIGRARSRKARKAGRTCLNCFYCWQDIFWWDAERAGDMRWICYGGEVGGTRYRRECTSEDEPCEAYSARPWKNYAKRLGGVTS